MLIEYTIEATCEPKRRLGPEGLFDRLRCLARVLGADAPAAEEAAAGRKAEFELRPLAYHCNRCPANCAGRAFGCFGIVQGPLAEEAEEWLIGLLPETLKPGGSDTAASPEQVRQVRALLQRLQELGASGRLVDEQHRGTPLLEGKRPAERRYGPFYRRVRLTSSQLIELLFLRGTVEPADAELVCRALAVWEDGGEGEDGLPEAVFTQPADDEDDPSVAELKQYFLTLMVACSLDLAVRVRLQPEETSPARGPAAGPLDGEDA
jgi:hypothetical protein